MASEISTIANAGPGGNTLVCPLYSNLEASAEARVEILQQSSVTMDYDRMFALPLSDVSSGHILNAFRVSGDGDSLAVDMRNGANFEAMIKFVVDNGTQDSRQEASVSITVSSVNDVPVTITGSGDDGY